MRGAEAKVRCGRLVRCLGIVLLAGAQAWAALPCCVRPAAAACAMTCCARGAMAGHAGHAAGHAAGHSMPGAAAMPARPGPACGCSLRPTAQLTLVHWSPSHLPRPLHLPGPAAARGGLDAAAPAPDLPPPDLFEPPPRA